MRQGKVSVRAQSALARKGTAGSVGKMAARAGYTKLPQPDQSEIYESPPTGGITGYPGQGQILHQPVDSTFESQNYKQPAVNPQYLESQQPAVNPQYPESQRYQQPAVTTAYPQYPGPQPYSQAPQYAPPSFPVGVQQQSNTVSCWLVAK